MVREARKEKEVTGLLFLETHHVVIRFRTVFDMSGRGTESKIKGTKSIKRKWLSSKSTEN